MSTECIKLVPFTEEELAEVQVTVVGRMLELNRDMKAGKVRSSSATEEMERLSKVSDKVSKYYKRHS